MIFVNSQTSYIWHWGHLEHLKKNILAFTCRQLQSMDNTTKMFSLIRTDLVLQTPLMSLLQKYCCMLVLVLVSAVHAVAGCARKEDMSQWGPLVWPMLSFSHTNTSVLVKITEWSLRAEQDAHTPQETFGCSNICFTIQFISRPFLPFLLLLW